MDYNSHLQDTDSMTKYLNYVNNPHLQDIDSMTKYLYILYI